MHEISREVSGDREPQLIELMHNISQRFDGAYSLVLLNSRGDMLVARDPLGIKPLCYAKEGPLFAAASESVALLNLGFQLLGFCNHMSSRLFLESLLSRFHLAR